ncbi:hypothetical protein [Vibrio vulnificus]|uniref:hypothetical protein n=1 Tax=Vibrio vulnificus TaxID=672 RepID=UPI001A2793CE|nr:hypothetical protein [Vibrio vulnificus]MCA0766354.1 hypothetical protein [Vibrio vulnificus]HAS6209049.1 hypothetical protein [Vibrio vulnificus]
MAIKTKLLPMAKQSGVILINDPLSRLCPLCRNVLTVNNCCDDCNYSLKLAAEILVFPVVVRRIKESKK